MIERHYDDEALIALLESDRADSDAHLPSCEPCSEKIESFRMIADALADGDVWDTRTVRTEAVPSTIATLRAFADRMTDEDTRADAILKDLLLGEREEWLPRLQHNPEWRTAGVVRKLIDASYATVVSMPPDAVAMTEIATDIAEGLEPASHPSDTIARLRGSAWRAKSYALYYVGNFAAAETALLASEREFEHCSINEYELARVGVVKALVLKPFERLDEATDAAVFSANTFVRFGDENKTVSAHVTKAHLLFARGRFQEAADLLEELERTSNGKIDLATQMVVLNNLAYAYRRIGQTELAIVYYDMITAIYDERGMATESARARWNCAAIAAEAGELDQANRRFDELAHEFERLGMMSESALVSLDRAELLLARGRFDEVEQLCRFAMSLFERAGLAYSTRALTAVAFMHEAAQQRKATPVLVRHVRDYIKRLPTQPNLLFAPPPSALGTADF